MAANLGATRQLVRVAGSLNGDLVPIDVHSFNTSHDKQKSLFTECMVAAVLKEPQAVEAFVAALDGADPKANHMGLLWKACRDVVEWVLKEGQETVASQQLTRQGVGRFSCLARTMAIVGVIQPIGTERTQRAIATSHAAGGRFRARAERQRVPISWRL